MRLKQIVWIGLSCLFMGSTNAQEGLYAGAGYDAVSLGSSVSLQNVHIILGHGISDRLSIEGEMNATLFPYVNGGGSFSKKSKSLALFTVARSKGDTFLKAKIGYSIIDYIDTFNNVSSTHKSNGVTYSIGVGLELLNGDTLEFDYTVLPREIAGSTDSQNTYSSITYKVRY